MRFFIIHGAYGNPEENWSPWLKKELEKLRRKTFVDKKFNWLKIKQNCKKFYVIHSDNDPYVPLEKGKELADKLGTEVIVVKGAGHFNEKYGFTKFELLLDKINDEI